MKTETRNRTKSIVILATERDDGQYEVDNKILSQIELNKLCNLMPGCRLVVFYDASINGIRYKARERDRAKNERY